MINDSIFKGFKGRKEGKGWILPNGRLMPTGGADHADCLKRNPTTAARYRIDLDGLDSQADHQECRLRAMRAGLARVRYDINGGRLGIELHQQHFDKERQRVKEPIRGAVVRLVQQIASEVDNVRINILDDAGNTVAVGRRPLFKIADRDKANHLPLVSALDNERTTRGPFFNRSLSL